MKGSIPFSLSACIASIIAFAVAGSATSAPIAVTSIAKPDTGSDVIVILRDQLASAPPVRGSMGFRANAVAASQSAVVTRLQQSAPRKITSFKTINAFATRVTDAERAQLALDPAVQVVVPDLVIHAPKHSRTVDLVGAASAAGKSVKSASTAPTDGGLCNTLEPEALQLTNTASLDQSTPQAQNVRDGNGKLVTGQGVKVAYIADGLDPNIPGFIRPDGSHVFVDYQDFTGDPAGTFTAGGEAFGDASSIAAQDHPNGKLLQYDISKFVSTAHPLPSPCNIQIRGMAPGASLVGLNVFSSLGNTTTSTFVQAIEYAVVNDDVDVINESFGGSYFPDLGTDPISLADSAAVAAGVTVVVSTGDAGPAGTLGSPATDADVIAVGASTQYRLYAQTTYGAQSLVKTAGWVNNQISPFSSGGIAQTIPRTVDVVAPGDSGWALCSTNTAIYTDCADFNGAATAIEDFGGTSESSPLTAGLAALVIQAYRSTHHGVSPTPAVVKQIIMSTSTDLFAPVFEQGAGLINSLQAVHSALGYVDKNGTPAPVGDIVLAAPTSVAITALPNVHETQSITLTNTGTSTRHFTPALQTLGAPVAGATTSLTLSPSTDPVLINVTGAPRSYIKHTFTVPTGTDHLDAAVAFNTNGSGSSDYVYLSLFSPSGQQVIYSVPQGAGNGYVKVDALKPAAGTWTAVIFTRPAGVAGSYAGAIQFTWAAENFVSVGTVSPSTVTLAPGATTTIKADFFTPSEPGDSTYAIKFGTGTDRPDIPVVVRTLIPVGATGGTFTGVLTGGNGRGQGNYDTFAFDVPSNVSNMSLTLSLPDNGYILEGVLVDPNGMPLSVAGNVDPFGALQYALQVSREHPQPGLWKLIVITNYYSSGNQTSLTYSARIGFQTADVTTQGLPTLASTKLSASGQPKKISVFVTNTTPNTAEYFVDPRLSTPAVTQLPTYDCPFSVPTTLPGTAQCYYLPTQVSSIEFLGQSKVPITMDAYNDVGYLVSSTFAPDVFSKPAGKNTVSVTLSEPEVPYGLWVADPSEIGPAGASGAPTEPFASTAYATMKPFDPTITADSGDAWADLVLGTSTFNPLVLAPGESGTISVTITPDPDQVGKTVSGFLYIDTYNPVVGTGDEVVAKPYSYTVEK